MDTKKILSKIENANLGGIKTTGSIVLEFIGTALIISIFLLFSELAGGFPTRTHEVVFLVLLAIYLLALLIYKHIVKDRFLRLQPKTSYTSKLFNRLFIIYMIVSVIVSTIVEYIIETPDSKWELILFALSITVLNYLTEGVYHYWGTIFYNSKAFVAVLAIISILNFVIVHVILSGILLMLAVIIFIKIISLFSPKGVSIGVDSFGRVSYFYYF